MAERDKWPGGSYERVFDGDEEIGAPQRGVPGKSTLTSRLSPAPVIQVVLREAAPGAAAGRDNGVAPGAEEKVARAAGSTGQPLPADVRRQFESSLGVGLDSVRVHTGPDSAAAASAVGARAYTVGQDIHFAEGEYGGSDESAKHLLAHEVAHTVQQSGSHGGVSSRQEKLEVSTPGDAFEREADAAADAMVVGRPARVGRGASVVRRVSAIQRQEEADASEASIRDFQPAFTVAEPAVEIDLNVEAPLSVSFDNASELPPGTEFTFEWGTPMSGGRVEQGQVTGATQSFASFMVKSKKAGAQTVSFAVSAKNGSESVRWEVPQTVAVTVRKPELSVIDDTAGLFFPGETGEVRLQILNVEKPKELAQVDATLACGASADDLDGKYGNDAFVDAWTTEGYEWDGQDTVVIQLKADHAGTADLEVAIKLGGTELMHVSLLECVQDLEEFNKRLESAQNTLPMITAAATSYFADLHIAIQAGFSAHKETIAQESKKSVAGEVVWGIVKEVISSDPRGAAIASAAELIHKAASGDVAKPTATSLSAMSSSLPGFTGHIQAAEGEEITPSLQSLGQLGSKAGATLKTTCANAIEAWRRWADSAPPDTLVAFDPSDALVQSASLAGTSLLALPPVPSPGDYEAAIWSKWVETNAISHPVNPLGKPMGDRLWGTTKQGFKKNGPIQKKLDQYGIPYPTVDGGVVQAPGGDADPSDGAGGNTATGQGGAPNTGGHGGAGGDG